MLIGSVSLMKEVNKQSFSRFLSLVAQAQLGERGERVAPHCREAISSTLCFTLNERREDNAGVFGQIHITAVGRESLLY